MSPPFLLAFPSADLYKVPILTLLNNVKIVIIMWRVYRDMSIVEPPSLISYRSTRQFLS